MYCSIHWYFHIYFSYGFHPKSEAFTNSIPALETVDGLAYLRWPTSNMSLIVGVRGTRSLLARVNTW